jgi:protein-S-isoprenylcysteine O-methyltransferase Ste14
MNIHPPLPTSSPYTPQQMQELVVARVAMKSIRRAIFMAQTDGWSLAVFALLSLVCGFSSLTAILVGLGLGVVAFVELRTIPRLKQLDPKSPQTLGYNQLALAGILICYAVWNLLFPSGMSQDIINSAPELQSAGFDLGTMESQINHLIYFALIIVALGAQGSLALFYFRRTKIIQSYLANTPAWIVEMQRAGFTP